MAVDSWKVTIRLTGVTDGKNTEKLVINYTLRDINPLHLDSTPVYGWLSK